MKKNVYFSKLFMVALSIALFSNNLMGSQRRAAGKRPMNYSGPMSVRQIPAPPAPTQDVENEKNPAIEQEIGPEESQEIQNTAQPQAETKPVSDSKDAQINRQSLGFFASMYASIAPLILVTLDSAIGKGTAKSTKSLIDDFMDRRTFLNLKSDIMKDATKKVESGDFDKWIRKSMPDENIKYTDENGAIHTKIKRPSEGYINLSASDKINLQAQILFKENKIGDPEKMEKQTSFASIFATAASTFVVNTAVNVLATFFGYGTKIGLNALMPDQK